MARVPVLLKHASVAETGLSDRPIDLKVVFTDLHRTAAALETARTMARDLSARITLLVAQVVPYPLPLSEPDVPVEFIEHMLESITVEDTAIEIYLCRDRNNAICHALAPDSVVVLGARKWRDRQLIRALQRDGRRVLLVAA